MSFKLMSHNTLDVSTIERTEQHIQRHQVSSIQHPYYLPQFNALIILALGLDHLLRLIYSNYLYYKFLWFQDLIEEIDAYHNELERVRELGQALINDSHHLPSLVQQTETQLSNLDESYLSLQATALQIKVSTTSIATFLILYMMPHSGCHPITQVSQIIISQSCVKVSWLSLLRQQKINYFFIKNTTDRSP